MIDVLVTLLSFGMLTFWGWVTLVIARQRHRSPLWFVAGLLGAFFATALVAMLPDLGQHCPRCKSPFEVGARRCSQCGAELPSPDSIARLGGDVGRFDLREPATASVARPA